VAAQKNYPDELRERAVKIVLEVRERGGQGPWRDRLGPPARRPSRGVAGLAEAGGDRRRPAARHFARG
jgi:hypothetical protein